MKIEKGVPMPESNNLRGKYPFEQMEIGDSFVIHDVQGRNVRTALSNAVAYYQNKSQQKFATRRVDGGWRVWRLI